MIDFKSMGRVAAFSAAAIVVAIVTILAGAHESSAVTGSRPWATVPLDSGFVRVTNGIEQPNASQVGTGDIAPGNGCLQGDGSAVTWGACGNSFAAGTSGSILASDGGAIGTYTVGGDVTASVSGSVEAFNVGKLQSYAVAPGLPPTGTFLAYDGGTWGPTTKEITIGSSYGTSPWPIGANGMCISPVFNAGGSVVAGISTDTTGNEYFGSDNAYSLSTMPNSVVFTAGTSLQFTYRGATKLNLTSGQLADSVPIVGDGTASGAFPVSGYTTFAITSTTMAMGPTVSGGFGSYYIGLTGTLTAATSLTLGNSTNVPPVGTGFCLENGTIGAFNITVKAYGDPGNGVVLTGPGSTTNPTCTRVYVATGPALRKGE